MAKRIKFPDRPTELKNLFIGDAFALTKGAPFLEKVNPPPGSPPNLCYAVVIGEDNTGPEALQSFTDHFLVYFIKHKTNATAKPRPVSRNFFTSLFDK